MTDADSLGGDDDWALVDDDDILEHNDLEEKGTSEKLMGSWHLDDDYINCEVQPVATPVDSPSPKRLELSQELADTKSALKELETNAAASPAASPTAAAKEKELAAMAAQMEALRLRVVDQENELARAASVAAAKEAQMREQLAHKDKAFVQLEQVHRENRELKQQVDELTKPVSPVLETVDSDHVWACRQCLIHVGCEEEVISKDFTGSTGRAYLVSNCVNFRTGPMHECVFKTGTHTVADIFCQQCGNTLGWKYIKTSHKSQAYKEGKFILEEALIVRSGWSL